MSDDAPPLPVHPTGEQPPIEQDAALAPATLDSWAGPVRVEWDPTAPLTPYGQLPFFIEYLKVACLFDVLVADCPLAYTSPNAPEKRDVLGTTMLSALAGHKRYAHITALRNDGVLPELFLGMKKIVSEDAVRRGFKAIAEGEEGGTAAAPSRLLRGAAAIRAVGSRCGNLYGQAALRPSGRSRAWLQSQEAGPAEPRHHTYTMAGLRLVLDVDVAPGTTRIEACGAGAVGATGSHPPRLLAGIFARR